MVAMKVPTDPKGIKVLIVSVDHFVADFLRGLVKAHGYDTEDVADFHEALVRVQHDLSYVVLIDDSCWAMENFEKFQLRMQALIQEGASIILLTDEKMKQHLEQLSTMRFFRIVKKPVSYLQISDVMADLMIV